MRRFARFVLGAAGGLALAGCTPTGSYQVSWNFFARADGTGGPIGAGNACGQHGVDAILVTGMSGGNGSSQIGLCTTRPPSGTPNLGSVTPGWLSGSVATGDWSFKIDPLDVHGTVLPGGVTTATMTVSDGMATTFPTVTLTPRPECSDGIDNDADGLVDGDDPGCANATGAPDDTTTESTPGASPPDGGASDGAAPDGSAPDGSAPDGSAPDGSAPDGSAPDGSALDGLAPDAPPADASGPDGGAADGPPPDDGGSDAGAPDDAATGG
jgi:hypothetical protein